MIGPPRPRGPPRHPSAPLGPAARPRPSRKPPRPPPRPRGAPHRLGMAPKKRVRPQMLAEQLNEWDLSPVDKALVALAKARGSIRGRGYSRARPKR